MTACGTCTAQLMMYAMMRPIITRLLLCTSGDCCKRAEGCLHFLMVRHLESPQDMAVHMHIGMKHYSGHLTGVRCPQWCCCTRSPAMRC
jgi:hypothetical protein